MLKLQQPSQITLPHRHDPAVKPGLKTAQQAFPLPLSLIDKPVMELDNHMAVGKGFNHLIRQEIEFAALYINQHDSAALMGIQYPAQLVSVRGATDFNLSVDTVQLRRAGNATSPFGLNLEAI